MTVILTTQNIGGISAQFLQRLCSDGHVLRDNGRSARKKIYALYKSLTPKRHSLKILLSSVVYRKIYTYGIKPRITYALMVRFTVFARSSVAYQATQIGVICSALANSFGFTFDSEGHVPGWAVNPNSKLTHIACEAYKHLTGTDIISCGSGDFYRSESAGLSWYRGFSVTLGSCAVFFIVRPPYPSDRAHCNRGSCCDAASRES